MDTVLILGRPTTRGTATHSASTATTSGTAQNCRQQQVVMKRLQVYRTPIPVEDLVVEDLDSHTRHGSGSSTGSGVGGSSGGGGPNGAGSGGGGERNGKQGSFKSAFSSSGQPGSTLILSSLAPLIGLIFFFNFSQEFLPRRFSCGPRRRQSQWPSRPSDEPHSHRVGRALQAPVAYHPAEDDRFHGHEKEGGRRGRGAGGEKD